MLFSGRHHGDVALLKKPAGPVYCCPQQPRYSPLTYIAFSTRTERLMAATLAQRPIPSLDGDSNLKKLDYVKKKAGGSFTVEQNLGGEGSKGAKNPNSSKKKNNKSDESGKQAHGNTQTSIIEHLNKGADNSGQGGSRSSKKGSEKKKNGGLKEIGTAKSNDDKNNHVIGSGGLKKSAEPAKEKAVTEDQGKEKKVKNPTAKRSGKLKLSRNDAANEQPDTTPKVSCMEDLDAIAESMLKHVKPIISSLNSEESGSSKKRGSKKSNEKAKEVTSVQSAAPGTLSREHAEVASEIVASSQPGADLADEVHLSPKKEKNVKSVKNDTRKRSAGSAVGSQSSRQSKLGGQSRSSQKKKVSPPQTPQEEYVEEEIGEKSSAASSLAPQLLDALETLRRADFRKWFEKVHFDRSIITEPMDFAVLEENIRSGQYLGTDSFSADINLMWKNARLSSSSTSADGKAILAHTEMLANIACGVIAQINNSGSACTVAPIESEGDSGEEDGARAKKIEPALPEVFKPLEKNDTNIQTSAFNVCVSNGGPKMMRLDACGVTYRGHTKDKVNQDSYFLRHFPGDARVNVMFGVFDGHGVLGQIASRLCSEILPGKLHSLLHAGFSVPDSLVRSIAEVNGVLLSVAQNEALLVNMSRTGNGAAPRKSARIPDPEVDYGTTAVVGVIQGRRMYCANVGDSRCVWGTFDRANGHVSTMTQVTMDHNPSVRKEEELRVRTCGNGQMEKYGKDEIRLFPQGMTLEKAGEARLTLNMSRALGHTVLSKHGVSPEPDIYVTELDDKEDSVIVAGSDGIWDVMKNEEVIPLVSQSPGAEEACGRIVVTADKKWRAEGSCDNISAVVIRMTHVK